MNGLETDHSAQLAIQDRRRPGRVADVSPELIPLLRGETPLIPDAPAEFGERDQLRAARGIALGVVISTALWAGLLYLARMALS